MCTSYQTRRGGSVKEVMSLHTGYCLRDMKVKVDNQTHFCPNWTLNSQLFTWPVAGNVGRAFSLQMLRVTSRWGILLYINKCIECEAINSMIQQLNVVLIASSGICSQQCIHRHNKLYITLSLWIQPWPFSDVTPHI